MAELRAFRAVRYTGPLEPVLAPPYDVLTDEQVAGYRAQSPHNVVHLTRPGTDYSGAARLLGDWLAAGVLVEDTEPAMYLHTTQWDGRSRLDLIAALRLVPYEERVVLPHEATHSGPKQDRLALLRATGMCLEPLWFVCGGLRPLLEAAPPGPVTVFVYAGERHTLRHVSDGEWISRVTQHLAGEPVMIADGHHRYETALAYAGEV